MDVVFVNMALFVCCCCCSPSLTLHEVRLDASLAERPGQQEQALLQVSLSAAAADATLAAVKAPELPVPRITKAAAVP